MADKNIDRISLREWAKTETETYKDFYYPMLACECSVAEIVQQGDAIQEAILKLLDRNKAGADYAPQSVSNVLGGLPVDIVKKAFDSLESQNLIQKNKGEHYQLKGSLENTLDILLAPHANNKEIIGYMFYNPIRKNVFPYFYEGNLFRRKCTEFASELYYNNKSTTFPESIELITGVNSEWDSQYAAFYNINSRIANNKKIKEQNEPQQDAEISLEEVEEYEEDSGEPVEVMEVTPVEYIDANKALVKPFKKKPIPVFVRMRIVYDESEMCGYRVESPFPLDDADWFDADIGYIRFNEHIAEKFTFKDKEYAQPVALIKYLDEQANTKFPNLKEKKSTWEQRMAERWPRVAQLQNSDKPEKRAMYREFFAYFKDIAGLEDNPPNPWLNKDLHTLTGMIDLGLEGWMHKVIQDVETKAKQQNPNLLNSIKGDIDNFLGRSNNRQGRYNNNDWLIAWAPQQTDIDRFLREFFGYPLPKDIETLFKRKHFKNALTEFKYDTSLGNSMLHKLINMMWLKFKYQCSTPSSEFLLKKDGLVDFVLLITKMQYARNAGDHTEKQYVAGFTEEKRRKHWEYIVNNFYKVAEKLLEALEKK